MKPQFGRGSFACAGHLCRISYITVQGCSAQMEFDRSSHTESIDNNGKLVAFRRSLSWPQAVPINLLIYT